ncbi:MAG TPA: CaiB/BaiF CoA-transferase family protein [Burkholderiaceae bacterium]
MSAPRHEATATPAPRPLEGIRILDLTRLLPGPAATMHLADFGADVIKVEEPGSGDYLRAFEPLATGADGRRVNPIFEALNRGKRSVRIDLKQPAGRDAFLRLVVQADAVIEGYRPGVMARLGLGWPALHGANQRLVLCSLSGYGQTGPMAGSAGHDIDYCALAGILDQNRAAGMPAIPNLQLGDLLGGALSALSSLLIALLAAQRSGQGAWVDVAMTDGLLAHHFFPHAQLDTGSVPLGGATLLSGGAPCYRLYEAADGRQLAVGALELKFWRAFCEAIELPELAGHHWSLGEAPGSASAARTAQRVAERIRSRTCASWESVFAAADACVAPVLTPAEALAHPQFAARGIVHRRGDVTLVGPLAKMSAHTWSAKPAPMAGADTADLLRQAGYSEPEIAALFAAGTAQGPDA